MSFIPIVIDRFYTGGHDSGYTSTLNYLENEGLLGKIILLNGCKDLAMDVRRLNLPQLEIKSVFMHDKLPTSTINLSPAKATQRLQFEDSDKYTLSRQSPTMRSSSPSKKTVQVRFILLRCASTKRAIRQTENKSPCKFWRRVCQG